MEYRRQCQLPGCTNAVEGNGRFCGPRCRTTDWKARQAIAKPADICPECGQPRRKPRGRPRKGKVV